MKGQSFWASEQVMLTSVRPDFERGVIDIDAVQTTIGGVSYGFIAPASNPDYNAASGVQKEYAFIGDLSNMVGSGTVDGFYII